MSDLQNIIGVEEAAKLLGLAPGTVKNYCREGKLETKKIGRDWALDKTNLKIKGGEKMRDIKSLNNVFFNGLMLHQITGIEGIVNNIYECFYANAGQNVEGDSHYRVSWDLSDFFATEERQEFDWEAPHKASLVADNQKDSVIDYFSGFPLLNKEMVFKERKIKVINRPLPFAPEVSDIIYWAGAVDNNGTVYKVFWNVVNLHEPFKIEKVTDKSRYCKKCLQPWMSDETKCVDEEGHEYVKNQ
ncbi:helix-turn-helix domain-containing protein [Priestia endophytica]|uniref:Helix-turn-helix domain-containing protein n=1 Tax=Priestia endophytica DSM 13796 TaxID=1121089 RepID=A0A1I6C0C6_9BACI|nr:helix-turn-helix domain-containing protein [Priestia endophytica]KYG33445.1 hypothetical protein AZF06_21615 [Priestia endophytica]SFQ86609.1 Helix-turn-helix domain-containing protein [Priestia endophytica DSM 13796]